MSEVVVCQNIGPRQRRIRYRFALLGALCSVAALVALLALEASPWWYAGFLALAWGSLAAFFEAHDSTCVALALYDEQNMDTRMRSIRGEPVLDQAVARQLRRQAVLVLGKAFAGALALTALALGLGLLVGGA